MEKYATFKRVSEKVVWSIHPRLEILDNEDFKELLLEADSITNTSEDRELTLKFDQNEMILILSEDGWIYIKQITR